MEFSQEVDLTAEEVEKLAIEVLLKEGWKIPEDRKEIICPECQELEKRPVQ